ncbi:MAG TPA: hypothetical protein VGM32_02195 [Rhodopila sp.]
MDQAYVSTFSALAGTVVGGVTSFATSWVMQVAQSRAARLAAERNRRSELYGRFLEETARLYSHAVAEEKINYAFLVDIFALRGRILLLSSDEVAKGADEVIKKLMAIYDAPNRSDAEVRATMDDLAGDPMVAFAQVCRRELAALR